MQLQGYLLAQFAAYKSAICESDAMKKKKGLKCSFHDFARLSI